MEGLTAGRMVHVNDAAGRCQPGVVTKVLQPEEGLINVGGWRDHGGTASWREVPADEEQAAPYGWHWLERA